MGGVIKNFILTILFIMFFLQSQVFAERLNYGDVLNKAIENSYDLKISGYDVGISKATLKGTKADLLPSLKAQTYSEHIQDLANSASYVSAGNTVLPPGTRYQNIATLGLMYNLYDFGATKQKVVIGKKDVEQKEVVYDIRLKDLKLKILDLYTKVLICNKEIDSKTRILKKYEELFTLREQLYKSGVSNKMVVMDEAVRMVKTMDGLEQSKTQLKSALKDLCLYTKQDYNPDDLVVEEFIAIPEPEKVPNTVTEPATEPATPTTTPVPPANEIEKVQDNHTVLIGNVHPSINCTVVEEVKLFDATKVPEYKYYNLEIQKKEAELKMYKLARYPAFKFYTNYSFYGQDADRYWSSATGLAQRNLSFGIMSSLPIFDGFKNKADRERVSFEIQKLQTEKEQKLQELENDYNKTYTDYVSYINELKIKKELLASIQEKLWAVERLAQNGMAPRQDILSQQTELLTQEVEVEKNIVTISSKLKEINIRVGDE